MAVCVCVCLIFYDNKAIGTHITLSQLDAAAPESSYPLGDKPASQPAFSQTLNGHSVIVVRHVCSLISNLYSGDYRSYTCRYHRWPTCGTSDTRDGL